MMPETMLVEFIGGPRDGDRAEIPTEPGAAVRRVTSARQAVGVLRVTLVTACGLLGVIVRFLSRNAIGLIALAIVLRILSGVR